MKAGEKPETKTPTTTTTALAAVQQHVQRGCNFEERTPTLDEKKAEEEHEEQIDKSRDDVSHRNQNRTSHRNLDASPGPSRHSHLNRHSPDEPNNLCWSFPKVKLSRLFTAKSLDDILGRTGRKTTTSCSSSSETRSGPVVVGSESTPTNLNSHQLSAQAPPRRCKESRSCTNLKLGTKSRRISHLTTSSSESNCYSGGKQSVLSNKSSSGSAGTDIQVQHIPTTSETIAKINKSFTEQQVAAAAATPDSVKGAKSDNCIHRILPYYCGTKPSPTIDNYNPFSNHYVKKGKHNKHRAKITPESISAPIPITGPGISSPITTNLIPIVPYQEVRHQEVHNKKESKEVAIKSPTATVTFAPPPAQEAIEATNKNKSSSTIIPSDMSSKEQAKLVVANVTYLQRPLSPSPVSIFPSPVNGPFHTNNSAMSSPMRPTLLDHSNWNRLQQQNQTSRSRNVVSPSLLSPDGARSEWHQREVGRPLSPFSYNQYHHLAHSNLNQGRPTPEQLRLWSKGGDSSSRRAGDNESVASSGGGGGNANFYHRIDSRGASPWESRGCNIAEQSRINRLKSRTPDPNSGRVITTAPRQSKDDMGDLQSPQYVKRTAHMFDSRYTEEVNGSANRLNGNGITSPTPADQPSYVKVSRSVCGYSSGYSCLSYGSPTGASPSPISNGSTHAIKAPVPLRPYTTSNGSSPRPNSADHHQSMPGYRPPDLNGGYPLSPKTSSSYTARAESEDRILGPYERSDSSEHRSANGHAGEVINNYTQNRCKSNILEKIERLYGANAVKSTSLWRRPVPSYQDQPESLLQARKSLPVERSQVESLHNQPNGIKSSERIIPIQVEDSNATRTAPTNGRHSMDSKVLNGDKSNGRVEDLYSQYGKLSLSRQASEEKRNSASEQNGGTHVKDLISTSYVGEKDPAQISDILLVKPVSQLDQSTTETFGKAETEPSRDFNFGINYGGLSSEETIEKTDDKVDGTLSRQNTSPGQKIEMEAREEPTKILPGVPAASDEKNGVYYLRIMAEEKSRIQKLVDENETRLAALEAQEGGSESELCGRIWAAVGKGRLLINKKFKQFEGLCNDNIEQSLNGVKDDEPPTKNEDLQGFWEMVLIQVDQIHDMFKNIDVNPTSTSAAKKPPIKKQNSSTRAPVSKTDDKAKAANSARDELRRKMLAERRQALKNQQTMSMQDPADVQIFAPDN